LIPRNAVWLFFILCVYVAICPPVMLICSQLAMCIYVYIYVLNSWLALLLAGQGNRDMEQLLAAIGGGILWLLQLKSTTRKKVKT